MRRGVGWLVQIDDTVSLQLDHGAGSRRPSARKRGEMVGLNIQLVEVLSLHKVSGQVS